MPSNNTGGSVVVVGSINVDLIAIVPTLPTAGETVRGDGFMQQNGGKSGNQAIAAARSGAAVTMVGAVGDDDLGRAALAGMASDGVDVSACRLVPGVHTGIALIVVDAAGENQIAVARGANGHLDADSVRSALDSLDVPADAVCLLGFEADDEAVVAAASLAAARGWRIVLNPAPARPVVDALLDVEPILTPNAIEARMLTDIEEPEGAARSLYERTGAPVIVTLGAQGALLYDGPGAEILPAMRVDPVDTTGAGDALNGIFAAELARGASVHEALRWAIAGAALKTTKAGAQAGLPTRAQISTAMGAS